MDLSRYARQMVQCLWRRQGGFIPRWYTDPKAAGHEDDKLNAMCEEFLKIDRELHGR